MPSEQPEYASPGYWTKEFDAAKKWFQKWHAQSKRIEKMYLILTEGDQTDAYAQVSAKYNLFWANVQTLLSSLYGRIPRVEVDRTNLDQNDDVARVGALILERIFNFEFDNIEDSPYYTYQECIQDRLVAGMGIAWARYQFTEGQAELPLPPGAPPGAPPVVIPIITDEAAPLDYVNWEDFQYSPCKRWQDKRWIARRTPLSRPEVVKRFGETSASAIPYDFKGKATDSEDPNKARVENQANIWEIWCVETKHVYWYVPGYDKLLDTKEDPLKLKDFWPCKRPLVATLLPKAFLPRPDFLYAKSQYAELNLIATRCQLLTEALKVVGVYDKNSEALQRLLNQASMNQMIPVDNWAMFAEKGGVKGAVDWFPLEMVINTLEKLTVRKASLVGEVYEILGISDIQRGQANSRETATTQRLKAQYGSARIDKTTNEVARFVTENTRLRAEIICKHWQLETIIARSQIMQTPDAGLAQEAVQFLKSDPSVAARITVSADTIAAPDWDLEKQQRIDFLQAISQFIGMAMPIIQEDPTTAPFMMQIMQWAATGFKGAKQIEGVFDQAVMAMNKSLAQPKPTPPPTPEDQKNMASAQKSLADARKINAEVAAILVQAGAPSELINQISKTLDPHYELPNAGAPPQGQGMVPPAMPTPSIPRPRAVQ
jgi:hypothetical protein